MSLEIITIILALITGLLPVFFSFKKGEKHLPSLAAYAFLIMLLATLVVNYFCIVEDRQSLEEAIERHNSILVKIEKEALRFHPSDLVFNLITRNLTDESFEKLTSTEAIRVEGSIGDANLSFSFVNGSTPYVAGGRGGTIRRVRFSSERIFLFDSEKLRYLSDLEGKDIILSMRSRNTELLDAISSAQVDVSIRGNFYRGFFDNAGTIAIRLVKDSDN